MPSPITYTARSTLKVPREALWAFLADTDRLNRALGLPAIGITPLPGKKGCYRAETRSMGMALRYKEMPFNWVEGRSYRFEGGADRGDRGRDPPEARRSRDGA